MASSRRRRRSTTCARNTAISAVSLAIRSNRAVDFSLVASPNIRSPRSSYVQYRVGQVVRHKIYGYRAVIIGWDEIASAPDEWLDEHHQGHPVSRRRERCSNTLAFIQEYRTQPNYSVLLDTRDRRAHKTYIPQEHIEVVQQTKVSAADRRLGHAVVALGLDRQRSTERILQSLRRCTIHHATVASRTIPTRLTDRPTLHVARCLLNSLFALFRLLFCTWLSKYKLSSFPDGTSFMDICLR